MMIPMQSIIIPEFVNIARVAHLNNQYLGAVLVYAALGAPFATYLMTTYYRGIPSELIEASVMDGGVVLAGLPQADAAAQHPRDHHRCRAPVHPDLGRPPHRAALSQRPAGPHQSRWAWR